MHVACTQFYTENLAKGVVSERQPERHWRKVWQMAHI